MPRVRSPELPQTQPWLNTEHPLSLKQLRERVVLLDFWTYGCINCLHVLSEVKFLERKYAGHLSVIGIHSGKFESEREIENVRQAVLRYDIEHPILIDSDFAVWQQYAVRAWPTLVLLDHSGYVVATVAGEGHRDTLDDLIGQMIAQRSPQEATQPSTLPLILEKHRQSPTPLAFPGKVVASHIQGQTRLIIADSGHHRLVVANPEGNVLQVIGQGTPGWQDGSLSEAQFFNPQGLALDAERQILYIADTGNHLLRKVNLEQQFVTTVAGTGQQSRWIHPHGGMALTTALNSPWDLTQMGDRLLIAMAGSHQIWELHLLTDQLQTYVGTGAEACVDGDPILAAFAQPSGITSDRTALYVADSETSSIRKISLEPDPVVSTVCGRGGLFEFGDRDGIGNQAQLQHCLGVTYSRNTLWIADTYNHKIKQVNLETGLCQTVSGSGLPGHRDGQATIACFFEPSGLALAGDRLYIADTNNHAIRWLDFKTLQVGTLNLSSLCAPKLCFPQSAFEKHCS